ncbi:Aldose 1-epimerase [compost metagenome]
MLAYWPHAAVFRFTYRLHEGRLTLSGEITNHSGTTMPLGLGFHPYFAFASDEAAKVKVFIPAAGEWQLDAAEFVVAAPVPTALTASLRAGVPVTELPGYSGSSQILSIEPGDTTCGLIYETRQTKLVYEMGSQFPAHVLFTPAWTHAVSLEPLTCIPDAFNVSLPDELTGSQGLAAGETFSFQWSIRIEILD